MEPKFIKRKNEILPIRDIEKVIYFPPCKRTVFFLKGNKRVDVKDWHLGVFEGFWKFLLENNNSHVFDIDYQEARKHYSQNAD